MVAHTLMGVRRVWRSNDEETWKQISNEAPMSRSVDEYRNERGLHQIVRTEGLKKFNDSKISTIRSERETNSLSSTMNDNSQRLTTTRQCLKFPLGMLSEWETQLELLSIISCEHHKVSKIIDWYLNVNRFSSSKYPRAGSQYQHLSQLLAFI